MTLVNEDRARPIDDFDDTFNAKWMDPELVARTFFPVDEFQLLIHSANSVLLGPRGCGKTTLLKMLTRRAITTWDNERRPQYKINPFEYPAFESIYIASDVRWLYEIKNIDEEPGLDSKTPILLQRAMINIGFLVAFFNNTKLIPGFSTDDEVKLCSAMIKKFKLRDTAPAIFDIRTKLSNMVDDIRGSINLHDINYVRDLISKLPRAFFSHSLDIPTACCSIASDLLRKKLISEKWALCYDELEIAPSWLRTELFESLRSLAHQNVFLKLTCSPILPTGLKTNPQELQDFKAIRLWHSHVTDALPFCRNLSKSFLDTRLGKQTVSPTHFFSSSPVIHDETDISIEPYERGSFIYKQMLEHAKEDPSFCELLLKHNINPLDPYTGDIHLRDTLLRKIAPIVLLRRAFTKYSKKRSIKLPIIYNGENAIYAMSEGNPRWLKGILNDLYDSWKFKPTYDRKGLPKIPLEAQARVLNNVARKFATYLSSIGWNEPEFEENENYSLLDFLNRIGKAFQFEVLFRTPMQIDPIGSFYVHRNPPKPLADLIEKAMLHGALIFIGDSSQAVPTTVAGQRFRLSYMLAPTYKLPLRNYKSVALKSLLEGDVIRNRKQLDFLDRV